MKIPTCLSFLGLINASLAASNTMLVDSSGNLNVQMPSTLTTSSGVVGVITSPGTASLLGQDDTFLSVSEGGPKPILSCRGATMSPASEAERFSLAATALVSSVLVVQGIAEGDVEMGLRHTRHARTLTALFRARRVSGLEEGTKQTLILGYMGTASEETERVMTDEIKTIYDAVAAEGPNQPDFDQVYNVAILSLSSSGDAQKVLADATQTASAMGEGSLSSALIEAQNKIRESNVASEALDPPMVASSFLTCRAAYAKYAKAARAKVASFKARVARGLVVDDFGAQAEALLESTLGGYDGETLAAAGISLVAAYRLENRLQLQALVEEAIEDLFESQTENLGKSVMKKFKRQLLGSETSDTQMDDNAASVRNAAFAFETTMEALEVQSLGLVKDKPVRDFSEKLTDALTKFPDSPEAKLKRLNGVKKTTSKEKKPASRAIDFGLDLVAMIRPDGFGSLQGFCGYNLGGNSITVGVANDADDPQVIAQMGGVRPPLIRVQPKLKVDAEF